MSEDKKEKQTYIRNTKRDDIIELKALEIFKRIDDGIISYEAFVKGFKAGYLLGQSEAEDTIIVI
jgi:hypothetical protein